MRVGWDTLYTILEGKLLEKNDRQLLLSVPSVKVESQYGAQSLYQRVDLTRQGVVRLDVRRVDKFRTYGLIGIAAGAAALITTEVVSGGEPGGEDGGGPPPPPDHIVGAILRLTFFRW